MWVALPEHLALTLQDGTTLPDLLSRFFILSPALSLPLTLSHSVSGGSVCEACILLVGQTLGKHTASVTSVHVDMCSPSLSVSGGSVCEACIRKQKSKNTSRRRASPWPGSKPVISRESMGGQFARTSRVISTAAFPPSRFLVSEIRFNVTPPA